MRVYLKHLNREDIDEMICEKCQSKMSWFTEDSVQGWKCLNCGWNLITTKIDMICGDVTEYSIYIKKANEINKEKIKCIARTAGVNFIVARKMLMENHVCILKDKAPKVRNVIKELEKWKIPFEVIPKFKY